MNVGAWEHEASYRQRFQELNQGREPYPYQVRLAEQLIDGNNVCLRAPTGCGKTRAALTPFLVDGIPWKRGRPARLIYALPLRSLVQQIHTEATTMLAESGRKDWVATIQTGEQPDDEFFDRGRIIVTTYDQVLSGLLCAPYGLSRKLRNVNAAAVAGAVVVFDEFHLMGIQSALLTGVAGLRLYRGLTQSVWMTATATSEPGLELSDAIDCKPLSLSDEETRLLPVVSTTSRKLRMEIEPLTADAVKGYADGRVIVIVNTVDRAQVLYGELADWARDAGISLQCLHARFFKSDRDKRVAELRERFGPGTQEPSILIATQVIEAGVDISCEHLLTELCPMNALLQRAGRCARFENEQGVIHVHPFPSGERSYLPYGNVTRPDPTLAETEKTLREQDEWTMRPDLVERWVQRVHGERDAAAIHQPGWRGRLNEVRSRIHTSLTLGGVDSVTELIRPSDDAQVRVIISTADDRPPSPAERDSLAVRRWSIEKLLRVEGPALAWYWDLSSDKPNWEELRTKDALLRAFVVCLDPSIALYSGSVGLRLGEVGTAVSPPRTPPKRPGYGSLHRESWSAHTRGVTKEIERRLDNEGMGSLIENGFAVGNGLSPESLRQTLRAVGLLHDLGKLQKRWQAWALRYQTERDPSHVPREPLAHTDFDPRSQQDRERTRRAGTRCPHAVASAWYGLVLLPTLVGTVTDVQQRLMSACSAAIVGHHGGWIPATGSLDVDKLVKGWEALAATVAGVRITPNQVAALASVTNPRGALATILSQTTGPAALEEWFSLVAYLTRALRLADQHATAEGSEE